MRAHARVHVQVLLRSGANPDVYATLLPEPGHNSTYGGQVYGDLLDHT
jgi:hypothetical protein